MPNQEPRSPVTIEQLLQLKRAERPDAQFWSRFDHELRQKQLAALLERRPWWQEFPRLLSRRVYLPVGASAVLAFTLISVKYYGPSQVAQEEEFAPISDRVAIASVPAVGNSEPANESVPTETADEARELSVDDRTAVAAVSAALSDGIPESRLTPWSPAQTDAKTERRSLAATFAQLESAPLEVEVPAEIMPVVTPVRGAARPVELAAVSAISSRRNRLLAELNDRRFQPDPQAPEIVRERLARRLADQDYTDSFARVGLKGDQVSLKF